MIKFHIFTNKVDKIKKNFLIIFIIDKKLMNKILKLI